MMQFLKPLSPIAPVLARGLSGFFPGGKPRNIQAAPSPPIRPPAPAPLQARSVHGAFQPAIRPGQAPRPVRPTNVLQPRTAQPPAPIRPQTPQSIEPRSVTAATVQPHAGEAFPLPGNFTSSCAAAASRCPSRSRRGWSRSSTSASRTSASRGPEASSIGALAFTHGTDVLLRAPASTTPNSTQGQQLLGHELTHVVQKRAGRVRNLLGTGVAVVQDPGREAEAERMGQRAATSGLNSGSRIALRRWNSGSEVRASRRFHHGPWRFVLPVPGRCDPAPACNCPRWTVAFSPGHFQQIDPANGPDQAVPRDLLGRADVRDEAGHLQHGLGRDDFQGSTPISSASLKWTKKWVLRSSETMRG